LQCGNGNQFQYSSPKEIIFEDGSSTNNLQNSVTVNDAIAVGKNLNDKINQCKKTVKQICTGYDHNLIIDESNNL